MQTAEQQLIGSILMDSQVLNEIYQTIRPEMITTDFFRDCYGEMLGMFDRNIEINPMQISKALSNRYNPEDVNRWLIECINATTTSTSAKSCANMIVSEYKVHMVKKMFNDSRFNAKDINDTIGTLLTRLEELQDNKKVQSKTLKQIVEENRGNYFNENSKIKSDIKTGLFELDNCLGGFQGGDTVVIGARPSVGKSALAQQIVEYNAKRGKKVGYFNLEMVESQVYERFVSKHSEIDIIRIRRALAFLGYEEEQFNKANDELADLNIVVSTGSKTDLEIKAECRHQNFDLIVIDYLQLVRSHKRCESRRVEVGEVSRSLKALAMELNVPIILLSQLSRKSENLFDREPTMDDLRETGDIEQDAAQIILMWNLSKDKEKFGNFKGIKVDKNRNGVFIREPLDFDGSHMTFKEIKGTTIEQQMKNIENREQGVKFSSENDEEPSVPWEE